MWTSSLQSYPLDKQDSLISTLLVPRGFDTLEYSKVKATLVSVRLQIYSVRLRTANNVSKNGVSQFLSRSISYYSQNVLHEQTYTYATYIVVLSFMKTCALME